MILTRLKTGPYTTHRSSTPRQHLTRVGAKRYYQGLRNAELFYVLHTTTRKHWYPWRADVVTEHWEVTVQVHAVRDRLFTSHYLLEGSLEHILNYAFLDASRNALLAMQDELRPRTLQQQA